MHAKLEQQLAKYGLDAGDSGSFAEFLQDVSSQYDLLDSLTVDGILQAVIDAIPGYVSWVTSDLHYLGVNNQLAEAYDLSPSDFIGREVGFLKSDGAFLEFLSSFVCASRQQQQQVIEARFGQKKSPSWHLIVGRKFNDGKNTVVIGLDVSELKRAEQLIVDQQEKIASAAKMAALGRMAAGIAHEINNPLTALLGNSSLLRGLLRREPLNLERLQASAEKIDDMAQRITRIVKSCKQFSRSSEDEPFQLVSVKSLLGDALELCCGRAKSKGVELTVVEPDESVRINCRPVQISQVLLNFLNNAIDAAQDQPERWIRVEVMPREKVVEIAVIDSGKGLPDELVEKIFEPFFTTKGASGGTGLGLNICSGIISEHQGVIGVDQRSENTRFFVKLPRY